MIDPATVNRILDTARIEEVVGDFVSLRKRGANYIGLCPFHNERTPSFSVSPTKGICKCFSCGKGGNVVNFIMEHEQMSYYEALKWLAKRYHIEVEEKELSEEERQNRSRRESLYVINDMARDYFCDVLHHHPDGRAIGLAYFRQRGIRDDILQKFQLGYCTEEREAFSRTALAKGYNRDLLVQTGLSIADSNGRLFDRYRGRVIFPVLSVSGKVVAFGGRILQKSDKLAKYINSPESEIYHKSNELYGLFQAKQEIAKKDRCYLVEGYVDVLSMHQSGICNVVASSGTSLTSGQIRQIHRFTDNITVLYDGDPAGIKASLRGINMLLEEGMNVRVLLLPDGEDPDSFAQSHTAEEFSDFIGQNESDFIRFKIGILLKDCEKDPLSRAKAISDVIDSISLIPNEIIRSEYIRECGQLMQCSEEMLLRQVNQARERHLERSRQQREVERRQADFAARQSREATVTPSDSGAGQPEESDPAGLSTAPENLFHPQASSEGQTDSRTAEPAPSPEPPADPAVKVFEQYERNLIQVIVRHGEKAFGNGNVIDFIYDDLQNDEIVFSHPLYHRMLEEAHLHSHDEGFVAERYFLRHPDAQISLCSADLSTERYELSRIFTEANEKNNVRVFQARIRTEEEMLDEVVPRLIEELKFRVLKEQIREVCQHILDAERRGDSQTLTEWQIQYRDLKDIEREFAKHLGERIISR